MQKAPIVIVLDIDGTIVGDVTYQVCEWELLHHLQPSRLKQFKQTLMRDLGNGLIRPHFADFATSLKSYHEHVELFIYTASDDKWAQFLVPCIEQVTGITFNKPIFSRKHCIPSSGSINKSLNDIAKTIHGRLKKKYGQYMPPQKMLLKNMCIIDNNNVLTDAHHKCVLCPTYSYIHPYDVLKHLEEDLIEKEHKFVAKLLSSYGIITRQHDTTTTMLSDYYSHLGRAYKASTSRQNANDEFWHQITQRILSAIKKGYTKDAFVKYISQYNSKSRG